MNAMMFGLERMQLPLSLRLIRELHRLLDSGRGGTKSSGEFRTSQTWIGGTRLGNAMFVPPPPNEVTTCLGYAEHSAVNKAGLIHVQFETIHPFLDGNGRLGRLLITLFLGATGVLRQPLLYLSLYFKSRRADYYRLLQEVREDGTWEAWLEFFLEGVAEQRIRPLRPSTVLHDFSTTTGNALSGNRSGPDRSSIFMKSCARAPI